MFDLRPYQKDIADKGINILRQHGLVYLAMQPRVGKTLTALSIADAYGAKNVVFLTKLKAIPSIQSDYDKLKPSFKITVHNYESIHKLTWNFDLVVCDESHCLSAFPKPSQRTKILKELCCGMPIIYLSATPTAESYSQIFHQFWISKNSPFKAYKNFYLWAREFVNVKKKFINGWQINDYSDAKAIPIKEAIKPYMLHLSQQEAGFTSFIEEEVINIQIDERLYKLMDILKKDRLYKMKSGDIIVADTPAKLLSCLHQISGGTIKISEDKSLILDESKAWQIKTMYAGYKIAIFYLFVMEGELLRKVFPDHTSSPEEFNNKEHLTFICQYASGKEGTNISSADYLVGYNISHSATTYWQFRERMQTKDRVKASKLVWPFSEHGIEKEVHKAVMNKRSFTTSYFKKVYQIK